MQNTFTRHCEGVLARSNPPFDAEIASSPGTAPRNDGLF